MTLPIRLILIDDHRRVHEAVTLALSQADDIQIIGHGSSGVEALELCEQEQPDLILMDVVMPEMNGVEATRLIHARYPQVKILVLSSFQEDDTVREMLANGASGYILKGSLAHDLIPTIRATIAGTTVLAKEVISNLLKTTEMPALQINTFDLTEREVEVLRHMANGLNNGEIAAKLIISQSTVKFHLANILNKMQVNTRAEAIVLAAKNNLL